VVIVLVYLVARPHIGTVYYVNTAHARLNASGFFASTAATAVKATFSDQRDCEAAATAYDANNHAVGADCSSRTALLWGW
jgi:hypothetical protein